MNHGEAQLGILLHIKFGDPRMHAPRYVRSARASGYYMQFRFFLGYNYIMHILIKAIFFKVETCLRRKCYLLAGKRSYDIAVLQIEPDTRRIFIRVHRRQFPVVISYPV